MCLFSSARFYLIIILISVFGLILFVPTQDEATITKSRSALSAKAPFKLKKGRADYFFMLLRDPAINKIPDNIHEKEIRFYELLKTNLSKQNAATSITWKEAGPFKVGGRTRALAIDINNPNVIIAGGASGGLWKSTDKGVTWSLKSTPSQIIGISSVAQDPRTGHTNTWYYSTGEYIGNSASDRGYTASYYGSGIYKSTDNGETWKLLDITKTNPVQWSVFSFGSKIVVHPLNGYVFVALNGLGIVRSDNGGESFALSLGGVNEHVFSDITIASDNTLIASISSGYPNWPTPKNNPGIYKSKDYGVKWTSLTPDNFPATHMRTVIGAAPSNANTAYILTYTGSQKDNRDEIKFYKLNVSNGSYEDRTENLPDFGNNLEDYINTQQNYNMIIAVKPDDENFVLIGATSLFRSTNGFMTKPNNSKDQWIGGYNPKTFFYPNLHPDVHSFSFDPTDPNKMWWGHDGGLSYTADIRNTNYTELFPWENKNNGYNVTQFYHITIPDIPNDPKIMGGTQDNGTPYFCCDGISTTEFYDVSSGDGSYSYFAKSFAYTSSQNGNVLRLHYDGNGNIIKPWSGEPFSVIAPTEAKNQLFINPFVVDPNNEEVMYYPSGDVIWRNNQLTQIPDNQNKTTVGWTKLDNLTVPSGYIISTIAVSKENPKHVLYYAASSYSGIPRIYKMTNSTTATNPVEISVPTAQSGCYVHNIAINPDDGNEIIVVFSNYNVTGLYHSTNGGLSYTAVEGNLEGNQQNPGPSLRTAAIIPVDGGKIYLTGTSIGLYSTTQLNGNNTTWGQEAGDLTGNVVVNAIAARKSDGRIVVATLGRGAFLGNTGGGGTAIATLSATQLKLQAKPDEYGTASFAVQNTGNAPLNFNISGVELNPNQPGKKAGLAVPLLQKMNSAFSVDVSGTDHVKSLNMNGEDVLYLDDGNTAPDNFLGYGTATLFVWANKFNLSGYSFDLKKIQVYLRTESSYMNGIGVVILNADKEYLLFDIVEAPMSENGAWYTIELDTTYNFKDGESFYLQIEAYNDAYYPAGFDLNGTVKGNSYYIPYMGSSLVNINSVSGFENGAFLLRAVGTKNGGTQNQAPVAVASLSKYNAGINEIITFDASQSYDLDGSIQSYLWNFGDGGSSTSKIAQHAYSSANTYGYTLTVTDNNGLTGQTIGQITISDVPSRLTVTPSAGTLLPGESITINVTYNAAGKAEGNYNGQINFTSNGGNFILPLNIQVTNIVEVNEDNEIPHSFSMSQNYPNPFNASTKIKIEIPEREFISLKIYDVAGEEIKVLLNDVINPGTYYITFSAGNLSSGIYFYNLASGKFNSIKKFVLMK